MYEELSLLHGSEVDYDRSILIPSLPPNMSEREENVPCLLSNAAKSLEDLETSIKHSEIRYSGGLSPSAAGKIGASIYAFSLVVFLVVAMSYVMFDSLKEEVVTISLDSESSSGTKCKSLNKLNKVVTLDMISSNKLKSIPPFCCSKDDTTGNCPSNGETTDASLTISKYFESYEECMSTITLNGEVQLTPNSAVDYGCRPTLSLRLGSDMNDESFVFSVPTSMIVMSDTCLSTSSCTNTLQSYYSTSPSTWITGSCGYQNVDTCGNHADSLTAEKWVQIVRDQYNNYPSFEEMICNNFKDNPPYQCVEYKTMSPLSIVSQSFAITTAITAGLFSFVSFFLD